MKKRLSALLLIMVLLFTAGCHRATLENYKLFRSTPLGFSVEYPNFWEKDANVKEGIALFVTPAEGYSDGYNESLSVQRFVPDMEGENAFTDYVKGYVANLESTLKNYALVSESDTTLGGKDAYRIVYESSNDDNTNQLRFMQIFAEHKGHIYVVSYIGEFNSYSYFLTYVEQMISTFTFI